MKFKSPVYSTVSGSIAGLTYARAKSGILYARARSTPVNPNTTRQQIARAAFSALSQYFSTGISLAKQKDWDAYAQNVTITDKFGDPLQLSGQQMFVRCNAARVMTDAAAAAAGASSNPGLGIVDDAPTTMDLGPIGTVEGATLDIGTGAELAITWAATPPWPSESDAWLIVQMGLPQGTGTGYFNGPWRFFGATDAHATLESTIDLSEYPTPYTTAVGQRLWYRMRVAYPDGRLSGAQIVGPGAVISTSP